MQLSQTHGLGYQAPAQGRKIFGLVQPAWSLPPYFRVGLGLCSCCSGLGSS